MKDKKKKSNIASRVLCGCTKTRYLGEDIDSGKVLCRCGNINEIEDSKTIKYYPNKLANSYQSRLAGSITKKGA